MPFCFSWAAGHCKNKVPGRLLSNIVLLNIVRGRIVEHGETLWRMAKNLFRFH